jgi:hypothetical protein
MGARVSEFPVIVPLKTTFLPGGRVRHAADSMHFS